MGHLAIEGIDKSFGSHTVLKDVSLEVAEGEFVTILGPSGSGKSTLFHLIGGLLQPEGGELLLNGKKITGERGHVSFMPQQHSLFPWRTVLQNALLGQELCGEKNTDRAREMIQKAGLQGYEEALPDALSGGMKQRVSFIRALLSPQSIMLLDEPFSALDDFTRQDMQQWLQDIWMAHRSTVLFITHNIEEALMLSDRIIVLSAKPARVMAEFRIPFARPRRGDLVFSGEFTELKQEITRIVMRETNGGGEKGA